MSLLGIDVGMSGCKAAAFAEDGTALASASREYGMLRPREGWAELDSRLVWESVREVIARVAAATGSDPVSALSVSSMGEAMVPVSDPAWWQIRFIVFGRRYVITQRQLKMPVNTTMPT